MAKKDVKITVMLDEEQMEMLSSVLVDSDVKLSEVVRSCIAMSLPLFIDRPSLVKIITNLPQNTNRIISG